MTLDLGTIEIPQVEKLEEPWEFRAANVLQDARLVGGELRFSLILDLGFRIYRQVEAVLDATVTLNEVAPLVVPFAEGWAENGAPNPLHVRTVGRCSDGAWAVTVERTELCRDTLKALGRESLHDALDEQGLILRAMGKA